MKKPGRNPPMKRAAIEMFDMAPSTTMLRQGGIIIPIPVEAATMAAARAAGYPARTMDGKRRAPIAEASAIEEPEIPEKNISATTTTKPSPPRICPTRLPARRTSRWEIPPCSISPPARMKSGIARKGNVSMPE